MDANKKLSDTEVTAIGNAIRTIIIITRVTVVFSTVDLALSSILIAGRLMSFSGTTIAREYGSPFKD